MRAIDLLRNRVGAVRSGLQDAVAALAGVDLVEPVVPGTSPLALTLWHVPRTQDWLVQTVVRGVPEIVEAFRDGLPDPDRFGFGTGLTPEQAREAAAAVDVPTMLAYADAVTASIDEWLSGLAESDLDEVPDLFARQAARPAYGTPEALAEAQGLIGVPVGVLMLRPVTSHCVMHFGEIDILSQVAAAR